MPGTAAKLRQSAHACVPDARRSEIAHGLLNTGERNGKTQSVRAWRVISNPCSQLAAGSASNTRRARNSQMRSPTVALTLRLVKVRRPCVSHSILTSN
jgi:hypothetical protein